MADSVADPTCALWDESGTRVVCATCGATLALLNHVDDYWGDRYRTLAFPHDEWVERDGVWRETHRARMLRCKGRRPGPRDNPSRVLRDLGLADRPPRGPRCYPTVVRCPACRNKRLLNGSLLDVGTYEDVRLHVERRALLEGLPRFGLDLLRDAQGAPIARTPLAHSGVRDARRRLRSGAQGSPQGLQQSLHDGGAIVEEAYRALDELEQFLKSHWSSGPAG